MQSLTVEIPHMYAYEDEKLVCLIHKRVGMKGETETETGNVSQTVKS